MNFRYNSFAMSLLTPIKSSALIYLFLLNVVSNIAYTVYANTAFAIFSMVMLASLAAYIETAVYTAIKWKWLRIVWLVLLIIFHNTLIITDYFLLWQFHMVIGQDVVDILAETNYVESENFISSYLSWTSLGLCLLVMLMFNIICIGVTKLFHYLPYIWPFIGFILIGAGIMVLCVYNYHYYKNGMAIPQYQTQTRLGYSVFILKQRMQKISSFIELSKNVKSKSRNNVKPSIVVIIGESFSVYHSSLYGYDKSTNPNLEKRLDNGSLFVFDNVVSTSCFTHSAMLSVFSLDSLGKGDVLPFFPSCFKAAGYHTSLYDNQYFVGSGINFLSNDELSRLMFDTRNTKHYRYDMDMIEDIRPPDEPFLCIIHLWGQHYTYSQRYPDEYRFYKANDYDKSRWTENQREVISHYDNATLYNDAVVDYIIRRFEHFNCCVIYFSDHGEEVYEVTNYMGHGNAEHSSGLDYQIRVPLMIWVSPSFSRPEIRKRLTDTSHQPITTDDISHVLLDVAQIDTKGFAPTRSFINDQYNTKKPRIVLHSIDYDYR